MKTVLCFSGGLDSTVLLYKLIEAKCEVKCLLVNYGQRHVRELISAGAILRPLLKEGKVDSKVCDLQSLTPILSGSSQTDLIDVPEGHYEEEAMKKTVVPNRNMILLSLATAWAISSDYDTVAYAAHAGDHAIYPDCRDSFIEAMERALQECHYFWVDLYTPFIRFKKHEIVALGSELEVPFKLTWSCYNGREKHCGKCGTCVERKKAFEVVGVVDPTEYE